VIYNIGLEKVKLWLLTSSAEEVENTSRWLEENLCFTPKELKHGFIGLSIVIYFLVTK
jgi:hypothetical protein